MIVLTRVVETCSACPSQWDAWDAAGNYYYLRYRWGIGTVERTDTHGDTEGVTRFLHGDGFAGVISLDDFMDKVSFVFELAPDAVLSGWWEKSGEGR